MQCLECQQKNIKKHNILYKNKNYSNWLLQNIVCTTYQVYHLKKQTQENTGS